ncbi:hypothetical protein J7438_25180 [Thalassotalea sp. G20_0]|uniref:hypothetical protein n=1 Tax=Thalassotalea sp. G20_0 TaxID=2821093 RepID=UPI001ADCDADB|nr:hypothetical protein [Thalassotalea sp. G20_0]MBO9497351.1 hypothetical protein [Thalassotalea sp. G20_0]
MHQATAVSPQLESFIFNPQIEDSDIPFAFFGFRKVHVQEVRNQPDSCHLAALPDMELQLIARQLSFSDFVNFSATHTRHVSCLRSDSLIKEIFDRDTSMTLLLLERANNKAKYYLHGLTLNFEAV